MSGTRNILKASQVRALVSSNISDADKMKELSAGAPYDLEATHALVAGLDGVRWKVVLGCVKALGHAQEDCADATVAGLLPSLNHPYSEVRAEAGKSLATLSLLTEVPTIALWEAFLAEEEIRAYHSVGRALLKCLRTWGYPATANWGPKLHSLLSAVLELQLTELPVGRIVPERNAITAPPPPSPSTPGLVARLKGQRRHPSVAPLPDPPPRPVGIENRTFLVDEGDRYRDTPEVICLLAQLYAYVPADAKTRLDLMLELCQMPLASFATSECLVLLAAKQVRDLRGKAAFLASMWGWGRDYEPTWTSRLALSAAQVRPDLRLPLFQFLRARHSQIDWVGWANSLRESASFELEPLVAATLAAPESELEAWMRLLSQAPVEHIVPALTRALGSSQQELASEALERLLHYGQPVPWLLNDIGALRQRWEKEFAMLQGLETLMSTALSSTESLPQGMREPDQVADWMLEDSAANPFSGGQILPWQESLQQLNAFYLQSGDLHILTHAVMVTLRSEAAPVVRRLPDETAGAGMTLLAAGYNGDLLFAGRGRSEVFLYLLRENAEGFQRLEPSIPADEVPAPRDVMGDGSHYGWSMTVERRGQLDGGLSLRKQVAYHVDPEARSLQPIWTEGMRPLENITIETADPILTPLGFHYSMQGGFRLCDSESLAIRTGQENPVHSQGRAENSVALQLEVFPSRLCRVYLWKR